MWAEIATWGTISLVHFTTALALKRVSRTAREDIRRQMRADGAYEWVGRCRFAKTLGQWAPVTVLVTRDTLVLDFTWAGAWQLFHIRKDAHEAPVPGWFVVTLQRTGYPRIAGDHVEIVAKWLWNRPLLFEHAASSGLLEALKSWEANVSPVPVPGRYR